MRRTLAILAAIVLTGRSGHGPVKVPTMVRPGRPMKLELRRAGNDRQDRRDARWFRAVPGLPHLDRNAGQVTTSTGSATSAFPIALLCVVVAGCVAEGHPPEAAVQIELEHIARITDVDEPGILPTDMVWLQETEAGTFVSASLDMTQITEFGPDGRLARVFGRAGRGPGEFNRLLTLIPGPGDTLFAPDMGTGRVTIFGPDRAVVGTFPMPSLLPDLVMPDGAILVASQIGRRETIGYPMHVVDREGRVVRSFGTNQPQYRPDLEHILTRKVALSQDGMVWAMAPARYLLERWDPSTGEQLQSIQIRSDWFHESIKPTDLAVYPPSRVEGLWEDEDGLVWTIVRDADVDWKPPPGANEHLPFDLREYNQLFDWVIEVVDPRSGRVLASRRSRETLWYRPPSRILVSPVDTTLTIVAYDVWKPTLQHRR